MADTNQAVRTLYEIAGGFRAISASLVQLGQDAAAATPAVQALATAAAPLAGTDAKSRLGAVVDQLTAAFQRAGAANVNAGLNPEIQRVLEQVKAGQTGIQDFLAFLRRVEGVGFAQSYGGRVGDPNDPLYALDQFITKILASGGFF